MSAQHDTPNKLLILLLGGRPTPALLLAAQLQPQAIACISSADKPPSERDDVLRALRTLASRSVLDGEVASVDPYRVSDTVEAVEAACRRHPDLAPIISVTGAPVPMTIAGYRMALHLGCPAYYANTAGGEYLDLTRPDEPDPLDVHVDALPFLAAQGLDLPPNRPSQWATTLQQRMYAAELLGMGGLVAAGVMAWLRQDSDHATDPGLKERRWPGDLTPDHFSLLERLQRQGILRRLTGQPRARSAVSYEIPSVGDGEFIRGVWLELYALGVARALVAEGVCDDATYGQKVARGKAEHELDLIVTRRGIPLIASCKTEKNPWKTAHLNELDAIARWLGGSYCTRLLIAAKRAPVAGADGDTQLAQAKALGVVLVGGDELPNLKAILRRELERSIYLHI